MSKIYGAMDVAVKTVRAMMLTTIKGKEQVQALPTEMATVDGVKGDAESSVVAQPRQDPLVECIRLCNEVSNALGEVQKNVEWLIEQYKPKSAEAVNEAIDKVTK